MRVLIALDMVTNVAYPDRVGGRTHYSSSAMTSSGTRNQAHVATSGTQRTDLPFLSIDRSLLLDTSSLHSERLIMLAIRKAATRYEKQIKQLNSQTRNAGTNAQPSF